MNHEINECLVKLGVEVRKLEKLVTEADEFTAVSDISISIHNLRGKIYDARKVFERTKDVENR